MAGLVLACPVHFNVRALRHPDRDRRDEPGGDVTVRID